MKKNNLIIKGIKVSFLKKWSIAPLAILLLSLSFSCGDDTMVAGGGISGTGITSVGPITGLGSIFVNDIEFSTDNATVVLENLVSDENQLEIGMVVRVEGTVNSDGQTGMADYVTFEDSVEGPVSTVDLPQNRMTVLGQTILIDDQTVFVGPHGYNITGLNDLDFNDIVEISGIPEVDGRIHATHIRLKTGGGSFSVSGCVNNIEEDSFMIGALEIDFSYARTQNFGSEGLWEGDFVKVTGSLLNANQMMADTVAKKTADFDENDVVEIEGIIDTAYYTGNNISGFSMITPTGRLEVQLRATTKYENGNVNDIGSSKSIRIQGQYRNNIMIANEMRFQPRFRHMGKPD